MPFPVNLTHSTANNAIQEETPPSMCNQWETERVSLLLSEILDTYMARDRGIEGNTDGTTFTLNKWGKNNDFYPEFEQRNGSPIFWSEKRAHELAHKLTLYMHPCMDYTAVPFDNERWVIVSVRTHALLKHYLKEGHTIGSMWSPMTYLRFQ